MSPLLLILIPLLSAVAVAFAPRGVAFRVATISTLVTLAVSLIIASDFGHWYDDGFGLVTELSWLPSIGASFDMHADAPAMAHAMEELRFYCMKDEVRVLGTYAASPDRHQQS